jgi:hypothetical protein
MPGSLTAQFHPDAEVLLSVLGPASLLPQQHFAWGCAGQRPGVGQCLVRRVGLVECASALLFRMLGTERTDVWWLSSRVCQEAGRHAERFEV